MEDRAKNSEISQAVKDAMADLEVELNVPGLFNVDAIVLSIANEYKLHPAVLTQAFRLRNNAAPYAFMQRHADRREFDVLDRQVKTHTIGRAGARRWSELRAALTGPAQHP